MTTDQEREFFLEKIRHFFNYGRVKRLTIEELELIFDTISDKLL